MEWRPSRWIKSGQSTRTGSGGSSTTTFEALDAETLITPHKGSFIAWSEGIRNCPGKKFSQVEFVAAMAGLFRDWRVEPVLEAGESELRVARKRIMDMVENDTGQVLLLQLLHPERAALAWKQR